MRSSIAITNPLFPVDLLDEAGIAYQIKEHSPRFFQPFDQGHPGLFYQLAGSPGDFDLFTQVYYKMDAAISRDTINQLGQQLKSGENPFDALIRISGERAWQVKRLKELKAGFKN